jgi:hypothetical protein
VKFDSLRVHTGMRVAAYEDEHHSIPPASDVAVQALAANV